MLLLCLILLTHITVSYSVLLKHASSLLPLSLNLLTGLHHAWLQTHKSSSYSSLSEISECWWWHRLPCQETFQSDSVNHLYYTSFEASAITLKLRSSKLTVFNVYRPPVSSNYAKPFFTFLEEFYSFLCSDATKPHEFLITGGFNIHVDDPSDPQAIAFLSMLERISQLRLTLSTNPPR